MAKIFNIIENKKERLNLETYSLSQTSLEQIFLQFARKQVNRHDPESAVVPSHRVSPRDKKLSYGSVWQPDTISLSSPISFKKGSNQIKTLLFSLNKKPLWRNLLSNFQSRIQNWKNGGCRKNTICRCNPFSLVDARLVGGYWSCVDYGIRQTIPCCRNFVKQEVGEKQSKNIL